MNDVNKKIQGLVDDLHKELDRSIRRLSPDDKRKAYEQLKAQFDDALKAKINHWSEVERGQHIEGINNITYESSIFVSRPR